MSSGHRLDDWRFAEDASIHEGFGAPHDWTPAGRIGNWISVNSWSRHAVGGGRDVHFNHGDTL